MRSFFNLKRQVFLVFAFATSVVMTIGLASASLARASTAISIKHNSVIEGNVITLGDVFTGLERKAEKVLGPAPRPGHDMVLNARTLMRIAIAMDLSWRPVSTADQVILSRAASVITPGIIEESLKNELGIKGISGKFDISIISGPQSLTLPFGSEEKVEIESIRFNKDQNRFDAVLAAPSKDNPIVREKISGAIQRLVTVPVLRGALKNGNVIRARDIDYVDVRSAFLKHDIILSEDELVGMTPRRIILAGDPIKEKDVQAPQIIERGELVTMVFENGSLSLTAKGKALESGAKGDVIRVVNANSSRTLEAQVTAQKEVLVHGF